MDYECSRKAGERHNRQLQQPELPLVVQSHPEQYRSSKRDSHPSKYSFVLMFCVQISHSAFSVGRRNVMPQVSFARDIRPLFRDVDISHMEVHGIKLDDYTFMSDPGNADKVLETLSSHEGDPPSMPPGGPYWTANQLALFAQWQNEGYQP